MMMIKQGTIQWVLTARQMLFEALYVSLHLTFTTTLGGRYYYYPHFLGRKLVIGAARVEFRQLSSRAALSMTRYLPCV